MKKQGKHYTPEEKVVILRRHLLEQVPISELSDKHGGGGSTPVFADDGQEGAAPLHRAIAIYRIDEEPSAFVTLSQFIKVAMMKRNGQKTQEIEVRKKHSSN